MDTRKKARRGEGLMRSQKEEEQEEIWKEGRWGWGWGGTGADSANELRPPLAHCEDLTQEKQRKMTEDSRAMRRRERGDSQIRAVSLPPCMLLQMLSLPDCHSLRLPSLSSFKTFISREEKGASEVNENMSKKATGKSDGRGKAPAIRVRPPFPP